MTLPIVAGKKSCRTPETDFGPPKVIGSPRADLYAAPLMKNNI
jgi:hypothetical protein